jgi:putative intracellular protease/amidase
MIQWTNPQNVPAQLVADKPISREEPKLKRASIILFLAVSLVLSIGVSQKSESAGSSNRVLLIAREWLGSAKKQYMNTTEAFVMKSMLEEAGFKVVIASASGRTFLRGDKILESDLKLAEVKIPDYVGFIIPCMAIYTWDVKPEEVAIAKQIVAAGKPVAAQRKGVYILAQAGVLAGKRHSYDIKAHDTRFDAAIYSGEGIVQDGNIITSTYCSYFSSQDQTVELTKALIVELQK